MKITFYKSKDGHTVRRIVGASPAPEGYVEITEEEHDEVANHPHGESTSN